MISKVKESIEAVTAQGDPFAESNKYIMGPRPPPSRCHTEAFLFMRSSALQRRRFVVEQEEEISDDRVSLLRKEEEGQVVPEWTSRVERLNYQMTVAETRVQELDTLHRALLSRPGIEDADVEERNIQRLTQETTALFSAAQRQLVELQRYSQRLRGREKLVLGNIVAALVARLQEVTESFRGSQGSYLRKVEAREKQSNQYFSTFQGEEEEEDDGLLVAGASSWSQQDVIMMEDQSKLLRKREQEITSIVQSIQDLNTIFKELATMVSEQGEMVDRIDVNIENASIKVDEGLRQLQQAHKHQKNNRKMKCIMCLAPSLIILLLVLIVVKS